MYIVVQFIISNRKAQPNYENYCIFPIRPDFDYNTFVPDKSILHNVAY